VSRRTGHHRRAFVLTVGLLGGCAPAPALSDLQLVAQADIDEAGARTFTLTVLDAPDTRRACDAYAFTYGLGDVRYGDGLGWWEASAGFDPQVGGISVEGGECAPEYSFDVGGLIALGEPVTLWVQMGEERAEAVFSGLDADRTLTRTDDWTVRAYEPFALRYEGPDGDVPTHGHGDLELDEPQGWDLADGINVLDLDVNVDGVNVQAQVSAEETWHACESRCGRDVQADITVTATFEADRCEGFAGCGGRVEARFQGPMEWSLRE
jgi:hypothetical protein